jgi:hypothetical protein
MAHLEQKATRSPSGRPIRIHRQVRTPPAWVTRRRRAYRVIDVLAEVAKRAVRRLVPRPVSAGRGPLTG